jgi:hypothetical protein
MVAVKHKVLSWGLGFAGCVCPNSTQHAKFTRRNPIKLPQIGAVCTADHLGH